MRYQLHATSLVALSAVVALGGCVYRERTVPAASPATTVVVAPAASDRVVTYPEGRYELRGDGTTVPYYWVWIPTGATPPNPPLPPRRPETR